MRALVFLALGGIVSGKSTMEASTFMNTLGSLSGCEFGKGDGVDIHGIRVRGGLRGG